ncbi:MAG: hypothetical protein WC091_18015 [Sulfuricellaceae bacterium]
MKLFIVAPINDGLTEKTTVVWAQNAVKFAAMQGISATPLVGESITRKVVEGALAAHQDEPGMFCFFDHGTECSLYDADHQPMIDTDNVGLLKNKFVYAVACHAAAGLGPVAIAGGAAGFLGFSEKVYVSQRADFPRLIGRCLVSGLITLLRDAGNAGQAEIFIREKHKTTILELMHRTDISHAEQLILADAFRHNQACLTVLGDKSWGWRTVAA